MRESSTPEGHLEPRGLPGVVGVGVSTDPTQRPDAARRTGPGSYGDPAVRTDPSARTDPSVRTDPSAMPVVPAPTESATGTSTVRNTWTASPASSSPTWATETAASSTL